MVVPVGVPAFVAMAPPSLVYETAHHPQAEPAACAPTGTRSCLARSTSWRRIRQTRPAVADRDDKERPLDVGLESDLSLGRRGLARVQETG